SIALRTPPTPERSSRPTAPRAVVETPRPQSGLRDPPTPERSSSPTDPRAVPVGLEDSTHPTTTDRTPSTGSCIRDEKPSGRNSGRVKCQNLPPVNCNGLARPGLACGRDFVRSNDAPPPATPHRHYPRSLLLVARGRRWRRWRPVARSATRGKDHLTRLTPAEVPLGMSSWNQLSDRREVPNGYRKIINYFDTH